MGLALVLPLAGSLLGVNVVNPDENRRLAPPPDTERRFNLRRFTDQFDSFYSDHFGFRPLLIDGYRQIYEKALNVDDRILRGRDDWLFLARGLMAVPGRPIPIIHDRCGLVPMSPGLLDLWANAINENHRKLAARGIQYVFMPVPNKHTIHGEFLPQTAQCQVNVTTRLQQLTDRLEHDGLVKVVDVRRLFTERAAAGERLYFKTDTHWNGYGMLHGYRALVSALPPQIKHSDTTKERTVSFGAGSVPGGDLAHMLGTHREVVEDNQSMVFPPSVAMLDKTAARPHSPRLVEVWKNNRPELSDAMFFHDSFFAMQIKFLLTDSFDTTTFVRNPHPKMQMKLVEQYRPHLVVHQMVERALLNPLLRE